MSKYECKNGCGYVHDHRGAMNIHEKVHCPKVRNTNQTNNTCDHEWRFLNPNNQVELKAINDNYMEVCVKCQQLKK